MSAAGAPAQQQQQQQMLRGNPFAWAQAVFIFIVNQGKNPEQLLNTWEQEAGVKVIDTSLDINPVWSRLRCSMTFVLPSHPQITNESDEVAAAIPSGAHGRQQAFIEQQQAGHGCMKVLVHGPRVKQQCMQASDADPKALISVQDKAAAYSVALLSWRLQHVQGFPLGWLEDVPAWGSIVGVQPAGQVQDSMGPGQARSDRHSAVRM
jgi:hypothetical protein